MSYISFRMVKIIIFFPNVMKYSIKKFDFLTLTLFVRGGGKGVNNDPPLVWFWCGVARYLKFYDFLNNVKTNLVKKILPKRYFLRPQGSGKNKIN